MSLDLLAELKGLIDRLETDGAPYALCGGLALAVHGIPRATVDIDLLVPPDSVAQVLALARQRGFTLVDEPMSLASGAVRIHRVSKTDPESEDFLTLDLLEVTPDLEPVWQERRPVEWEGGRMWVASPEGLIRMKELRGSGTDRDDIRRLRERIDET